MIRRIPLMAKLVNKLSPGGGPVCGLAGKNFAGISLALICIISVLTSGTQYGFAAHEVGIVVAHNLNLRPAPGTDSPPLTQLKKGTRVTILSHQDGWLKVRHLEQIGYIQNRKKFVRIISVDPHANTGKEHAASGETLQQYKKESEEIHREIEKTEKKVQQYTSKETDILNNLNDLDYSISRAGRRISVNRAELKALQKKAAATRDSYKALVKKIEQSEEYTYRRLVALYKLNRLGKLQFLASSGSMYELLYRQKSLEHILSQDERQRENLLSDRTQLKQVLDQLNDQQVKKRTIEASIEKELKTLSAKRSRRSDVLAKIREEKALQIKALDSLTKASIALDQTIDELAAKPEESIADISIQSFDERKGLLNMPVKGKIISRFGPHKNTRFNVTVFSSGIDIKAEKGAVIQAVYAGQILFADWFKGYGNMIIIDHGGSYYTVYAHLQEMYKQKGDYVNTGQAIATVGDTGSMAGPVLHFEVRHHGKPLNPLQWIAKK